MESDTNKGDDRKHNKQKIFDHLKKKLKKQRTEKNRIKKLETNNKKRDTKRENYYQVSNKSEIRATT